MPVICTIVAKNYISFARTLCRSFLKFHPDGKCYVLIADDIKGYVDPAKEPFEIVELDRLGIQHITEMTFKYDVVEFCTALKPHFLEYLFSQGVEKVLYLDPDILVTNKLSELYENLEEYDFLLTPHTVQDYPNDGKMPDDTLLNAGLFNLGFIGIRRSENSKRFLDWWKNKLFDKCVADGIKGYFFDQACVDMATIFFSGYKIIFDRGYNASYWNLHEREIGMSAGGYTCNGEKLYFYHFSGYSPERPEVISANQTRSSVDATPGLKPLFSYYTEQVMKNNYRESRRWPYSYNYFSNGKRIQSRMRPLYRQLAKNDPKRKNPFDHYYYFFFQLKKWKLKEGARLLSQVFGKSIHF